VLAYEVIVAPSAKRDIGQIAAYLRAEGLDADAVFALADGPATADVIARNTQDTVAADAIGTPVYVLNGEPFWGQDRLDLLERALATGRAPFQAI
jgi:2-hydroxychromene-2-carboxylate isomerase